jgi:hypothetical protein
VKFDKNGDRMNKLWIEQLHGNDEIKLGTFDSTLNEPNVRSIKLNSSFKWPGI